MTAPLDFANELIVTPAAIGPRGAYQPLWLYKGGSFAASWAWIDQGVGVPVSTATMSAVFRQVPSDTPLAQVGTTSTAQGSITFLSPVPNFPYLPDSLAQAGSNPSVITLYPFEMSLTSSGVSGIAAVSYCQWALQINWPDGTVTELLQGPVYIQST